MYIYHLFNILLESQTVFNDCSIRVIILLEYIKMERIEYNNLPCNISNLIVQELTLKSLIMATILVACTLKLCWHAS